MKRTFLVAVLHNEMLINSVGNCEEIIFHRLMISEWLTTRFRRMHGASFYNYNIQRTWTFSR